VEVCPVLCSQDRLMMVAHLMDKFDLDYVTANMLNQSSTISSNPTFEANL
jgi:hypothetical protein